MTLADISRADVLTTIKEFDNLGREPFLERYGFSHSRRYYLEYEGKYYDSKAIVGVAHQVSHGVPLASGDFSGGEQTVARLLRRLSFVVVVDRLHGAEVSPQAGASRFHRWQSASWETPIGTLLTREARADLYGGAVYGGIEPSAQTANVFVYSDPAAGKVFGYNFDGWNADKTIFLYTGEGKSGPQEMRDGNRALRDHRPEGRALRLFVADGTVPGSDTKNHRYIGEFEVDADQPFLIEDAPDEEGNDRTVFVFRLRPTGNVLRRDEDRSETGDAPRLSAAELIAVESFRTSMFTTGSTGPTTAQRRESELTARYKTHIGAHDFKRWKITPVGEIMPLYTDIFDITANELIEAKGTSTRAAIRTAVGQLLDYRRHIPGTFGLAVLLPSRPNEDLVNLLDSLGIVCIYEAEPGQFLRINPTMPA